MKKGLKILLIIAIIVGVAFVGYTLYKKYSGEKMEEIKAEDGFKYYVAAMNRSLDKEEYAVTYSIDENRSKDYSTSGIVTIDDYGYYHNITDGTGYNEYVVKVSDSKYNVYRTNEGGHSTTTITRTKYNTFYKNINKQKYLGFLGSDLMAASEEYILDNYYAGLAIEEGEFTNVFGVVGELYVWKTTYTCKYQKDGVKYTSTLVRDIYFDTDIKEINLEILDNEVDDEGKVKSKGDEKTLKINHKFEYKTNHAIVKSDFSEFVK